MFRSARTFASYLSLLRSAIAVCAIAMLLLPASNTAIAQTTWEVTLTWTNATQNEDGTTYDNPSHHEIHWGCATSRVYDQQTPDIPHAVTSYTITDLPEGATCYFAGKHVNLEGEKSQFSGEAVRSDPDSDGLPYPIISIEVIVDDECFGLACGPM